MKRLPRFVLMAVLALLLMNLLAACANPIGSRTSPASNQPPAVVQPANNSTNVAADSQADDIEQSLNDLDNQLKATDTLDDLK